MAGEFDFGLLDVYTACTLEDLHHGAGTAGFEDLTGALGAVGEGEADDLIEAVGVRRRMSAYASVGER